MQNTFLKRTRSLSSHFNNSQNDLMIRAIRVALILLNYAILLLTTIVIAHTTNLVCTDFEAYKLLSSFSSVPIPPESLILYSQLVFLMIVGLIILRARIKNLSESLNLILIGMDIILALILLYYLNISNKSILLLIITNIIVYVNKKLTKYIFLTFCILLYIILDFDILSSKLHLYSFGNYLYYYKASTRIVLFGIRNLLYSVTLVFFILFMIFEIQVYLEETRRVKQLNKALFESTHQLQLSNIQLKEYWKRNEEMAKLKERNRLARDIHDTIGHYLTAIDLGIKVCLKVIEKDPQLLPSHLGKVHELTQKSLLDIRRSIKELQPDALTRYTLHSAITNLAKEISNFSKAKVGFSINGTTYKLNTQIEESIYHIAQEGISNAVRHSNPTSIKINLTYQKDGVNLLISNNGLKQTNIVPGFGLTHIKEKIEELSGSFQYRADSEKEFTMQIFIPQAERTS
jgi:signal transduction histidine kinase